MGELNLEKAFLPLIIKALNKHKWKTQASKELGMTVRNLNYLIPKYNIVKINGEYTQQPKK